MGGHFASIILLPMMARGLPRIDEKRSHSTRGARGGDRSRRDLSADFGH